MFNKGVHTVYINQLGTKCVTDTKYYAYVYLNQQSRGHITVLNSNLHAYGSYRLEGHNLYASRATWKEWRRMIHVRIQLFQSRVLR